MYSCESGCGGTVRVYGCKWCPDCYPDFSKGQACKEKAFVVVAGKYEEFEGEQIENFKYISEPMLIGDAEKDLERVKGYPFARIEYQSPDVGE